MQTKNVSQFNDKQMEIKRKWRPSQKIDEATLTSYVSRNWLEYVLEHLWIFPSSVPDKRIENEFREQTPKIHNNRNPNAQILQ